MQNQSYSWWPSLFKANRNIITKAASQVIIIGVISLLPLILGAFGTFKLQPILEDVEAIKLSHFLYASILKGQLYYYSMSFIAAVIWHSAQDLKKPFPPRILFFIVSFILGVFCAFFFGLEPALPLQENSDLSYISIIIYFISASMYFILLIFQEIEPPKLSKAKAEDDDSFLAKYKQRKGVIS